MPTFRALNNYAEIASLAAGDRLLVETDTGGPRGIAEDVVASIAADAVAPQLSKGWVKFDNTGTISASHNVSSVDDISTGQWTVNWGTDFASSDYAVSASILLNTEAPRIVWVRIQNPAAVRINTWNLNAGSIGELNITDIYVIAFGSQ